VSSQFKILVVDDNRSLTEALGDVFEAKGYAVELAFDGDQAVERVRSSSFDCILMDVRMPRMSGVDAFKEIKKLSPAVPVILMTAYSVQGLIEEARAEGVAAIVQKPVAIDKIIAIIEELKGSALIVDASPDATLKKVLTDSGYRLAITSSAAEAITMVAEGQYDAVMLSVEIEGLTSMDSIVYFRECNPKCLIILMSTESQPIANPYACATLQKPFKMKDVIAVVDRVRARKLENKLGGKLFEV
jgi:DNA-binding NtrC family response regulator